MYAEKRDIDTQKGGIQSQTETFIDIETDTHRERMNIRIGQLISTAFND